MSESFNPSDRAAIEAILSALETAWNAGDGVSFGTKKTEHHILLSLGKLAH